MQESIRFICKILLLHHLITIEFPINCTRLMISNNTEYSVWCAAAPLAAIHGSSRNHTIVPADGSIVMVTWGIDERGRVTSQKEKRDRLLSLILPPLFLNLSFSSAFFFLLFNSHLAFSLHLLKQALGLVHCCSGQSPLEVSHCPVTVNLLIIRSLPPFLNFLPSHPFLPRHFSGPYHSRQTC